MDYVALSKAVESIWLESDEISRELDRKFEERQRKYIQEKQESRPSYLEMRQEFNL